MSTTADKPAETGSHRSINGEFLVAILVRVYYHSNRIDTVYFSTWLYEHKISFAEFWNSHRNHNALREMFTSLQKTLGRHITLWLDIIVQTIVLAVWRSLNSKDLFITKPRSIKFLFCQTFFSVVCRQQVSCKCQCLRAAAPRGIEMFSDWDLSWLYDE